MYMAKVDEKWEHTASLRYTIYSIMAGKDAEFDMNDFHPFRAKPVKRKGISIKEWIKRDNRRAKKAKRK